MPAEISKVKELFLAVLEMPAAERATYLDTACAGDTALRQQIEAMLQSHENSGELLARSPAELLQGGATDADATGAFTPSADPSATQLNPTQHESDELSFLAPSAKPGQLGRLGPYEVQKVLGKGGFGVVLKAFDERLHRVVAIKVLSPAYAAIGTARKRFIREAQAAAAVKNEHVVGIHDVDANANPPFLVMEYIEGGSLQDKIDKDGTIGVKELLRIGMQMAEGLAAAHKQGLVHRDIKPANILLENGVERVKITDFGLARAVDDASVTQSGVVAGTPMYMSPEQAEGLPVDHRSDLFSLGTVLYAMCTGHPPFRASGTHAVLKRVIDASPRPIRELNSETPEWLCAIIVKLHAKKPEERFQTATEVAELVGQHLAHLQQPTLVAKPTTPAPPAPMSQQAVANWMRARRTAAAAFAVAGGLTTYAAVGLFTLPAERVFPPGAQWLVAGLGLASLLVAALLAFKSRRRALAASIVVSALVGSIYLTAHRGEWPAAPDVGSVDLRWDDPSLRVSMRRTADGEAGEHVYNNMAENGAAFSLAAGSYVLSVHKGNELVHTQDVVVKPGERQTVVIPEWGEVRFEGPDQGLRLNVNGEVLAWQVKEGKQVFFQRLPKGTVRWIAERAGKTVASGNFDLRGGEGKTEVIAPLAAETGWVQLFNGKDLSGWVQERGAASWKVIDGVLTGSIGPGGQSDHLRAVNSERDGVARIYANFHLRVEVRVSDAGHGAILFRQGPGSYRLHIGGNTTGSIGLTGNGTWLQKNEYRVAGDRAWSTLELIADGPSLVTKVDGQVVASVADKTLARGGLQLELASAAEFVRPVRVEFRKIEIKELPPAEPDWVQLFNGKDLNGWKVQGIDKGQWKWEQNALAVNAVDNGTALLQSLKEYRNFEMRFQARILDTHVILRLRWADRGRGSTNVTLGGAENSPERWGRISPFDETMDKANRSGMDAALKTIKGGDFNDVLVKFVGRRITVKINGVTTYEGDTACDHDAGIIDWSTSGPGRAWIRNAEIKELAPEVPGAAPVELCKFEGEKTTPWTVVLSQDGSRALSGHRESGQVILWDVAAGTIVKRMANGHPGVQAVAFGPDESWAVSGGTDKIVRIWDLKTGEQLRQSEKLGVNISKLVLFRDGKRALVGATDGRGALIDATQVPLRWLGLDPFIPTFFDTDTNKVGSLAVALSPDESLALSGGGTKVGKIGLWNVKSGKFVRLFKSPHAKQIRWLAFAPDGTRAVSASADGTCRIWDVASGEEKLAFTKHGQQVQHAVFFPDGRHVVSTGWDNFARIWDSQTGNEVHVIALPSKGCSLALSADGRLLLIGCSDSGPAAEKVDFGIRAWQLPPMPIDETGWTPLFNGKDLAGWDLSGDDPAAWSVKDGQLVAKSKSSMLRTKRANFVNFRLRAEAKIDGKGTAWLWFRTKEIGKRPGHAVVLNGAEVRPLLNGYLMGVPDFGDSMTAGIGAKAVPPDDWFTLELIADGHKLLAKINGVTTGESSDISMQNGVICLQIGEGTQIVFRKIEIQELPHGPPVSDRAKLQGEWIGKKNEVKGKVFPGVANFSFTFTGDRARLKITAEAEPSKIIQDLEGVLLLDPSANPKRIRVIAPDTAKNVKQFIGIYDWQGDDLRICYQLYEAAPAEPEYPTAFASDPKSPYKILVLRRAAAGPIEPAWVPLFNGKDLKNWTLPATGCEVKDGELILKTGNATATIATDGGAPRFHLRAEAKISPNVGGFFEFWPKDKKSQLVFLGASNGHIRGAPFKKTPYPADWFLLEVLATEDRITVKVDGVTTSEYQLTDADRKNREGEGSRCLRFSAGGLTELRFRKIEIKELPPE